MKGWKQNAVVLRFSETMMNMFGILFAKQLKGKIVQRLIGEENMFLAPAAHIVVSSRCAALNS